MAPICELIHLPCVCLSASFQQATITACASTFKHHTFDPSQYVYVSIVSLAAAICICAQQIFLDGSAKKKGFVSAFQHAAAIYFKNVPTSGFLDEIQHWVVQHEEDLKQLEYAWETRGEQSKLMAEEVTNIIKEYRPRIYGARRG